MLSYSLTQQDRPSQFTGGTQSDVQSLTFTADAGRGVSITPTYTVSQSSSQGYTSSTNLNSWRIEYLPAEKPWEASYKTEWSDTTSTSATSDPSGSNTKRLTWDFKYKFSENTSLTYRFNRNNTTTTTAFSNSEQRQTLQYRYSAGDKWDLIASYSLFDRSSTWDTSERNLELESRYRLSEILLWNLNYNLLNYSSAQRPANDYSGNILETELRLEF